MTRRADETTLYVAGNGDDQWSGRHDKPRPDLTDGPLRTLEGARDQIREIRAGTGSDAMRFRVSVRAGVYPMQRSFTLECADSGSREHPVIYRSVPGETAVLSGGIAAPDCAWTPVTNAGVLDCFDPAARGKVLIGDATQCLSCIRLTSVRPNSGRPPGGS